jgi:adenine-specific DNA-methyltransferase
LNIFNVLEGILNYCRYSSSIVQTEGIKYIGSKKRGLDSIVGICKELGVKSVFDGFSGTTRVSQALAKSGFSVTSNDKAIWSKVFAQCYLLADFEQREYYSEQIQLLNELDGKDGWFTQNYGGVPNGASSIGDDGLKKPWQTHNTRKLDAIREAIDDIASNEIEKSVYLTSLILAMDKVDSTIGHHVSYLREWSQRSYNDMKLELPEICPNGNHRVLSGDVFDVVGDVSTELSYYDPPYGSANEKMPPSRVRYSSYYHLWKSVCLNDQPELVGVAKRRADVSDTFDPSVFEDFRKAESGKFIVTEAVEKLIDETKSRYVLLSYGSTGRLTRDEILKSIREAGYEPPKLSEWEQSANVMAAMTWTDEWTGQRTSESKNTESLMLIDTHWNRAGMLWLNSGIKDN